jgi:hypothetical protein
MTTESSNEEALKGMIWENRVIKVCAVIEEMAG